MTALASVRSLVVHTAVGPELSSARGFAVPVPNVEDAR